MVPSNVCMIPKDYGVLGLINVAIHGSMIFSKWVVRCLEVSSPWKVLMRHRILIAKHVVKVRG